MTNRCCNRQQYETPAIHAVLGCTPKRGRSARRGEHDDNRRRIADDRERIEIVAAQADEIFPVRRFA